MSFYVIAAHHLQSTVDYAAFFEFAARTPKLNGIRVCGLFILATAAGRGDEQIDDLPIFSSLPALSLTRSHLL